MGASVYDNPVFFERYLTLRENPNSVNELIEKPTMFALLPPLAGKRVLDLGCGVGDHLQVYLQRGASQVVGLDLSQSMLKQAEIHFANAGWDRTAYRFYHGSMAELEQVEESAFDVITSSFAFHYIADFPALLAQIHAKLADNGVLIFSQEHPIVTSYREGHRWEKNAEKQQVAYRLNFYRDEGERERNWFKQPFKTYHRTMATIFNQLIQAGFSLEQVEEPMLADALQWHNVFKDLQHRPPLLFVKGRKEPSV